MPKLIIFGGSGFVGGNLAVAANKKGWSVVIADSLYRPGLQDVEWRTADITDGESVARLMDEVRPDAAVNVAAVADVDKAERDKELAYRVNVKGARNVAESCARLGCRYVFFSSDAVFDGKSTAGYCEEDAKAPVNYYGQTKSEAEDAVFAAYPGAVVIRISLVIGLPVTGGNSFFGNLRTKLEAGTEVLCPVDEVRTPIDVLTLCESVMELAEGGYAGVLHLGAIDSVDRFTLTKKAAETMGFDTNLVKVQPPKEVPGRAPRHKNGVICVDRARAVLKTKMLPVAEGIRRAIKGDNSDG